MNRRFERHRKPQVGGLLPNSMLIAVLAAVALYLGLFIIKYLPILGFAITASSLTTLFFSIRKLKIGSHRSGIDGILEDIHLFFYENNLIVQDSHDINYYRSPAVHFSNNSLYIAGLPSLKTALLSEDMLDALQAYLDSFDFKKNVGSSYYENGWVIVELRDSLDNDRLEF